MALETMYRLPERELQEGELQALAYRETLATDKSLIFLLNNKRDWSAYKRVTCTFGIGQRQVYFANSTRAAEKYLAHQ